MDESIIRITKELSDIQKTSDLSLAIACRDVDVRNVKALIIGPHETPYEFGFYEFSVRFNREYPRKSPNVTAITTNGGRCRFNPNIYANGKVCLSILGTWRGEPGEEWSAAQGLESILLSIQSLMSSNPYENEPGYEDARTGSDQQNQSLYVQKIRHESLRISVIQRLEEYLCVTPEGIASVLTPSTADPEAYDLDSDDLDETTVPFEPFKDLCKRRFLWYFDSYLAAVQKGSAEIKDGDAFHRMPFESSNNMMEGRMNYSDLERRLRLIKKELDKETKRWAVEGLEAKINESTVAVNLQHQYEQTVESFKQLGTPHDVQLENKNPFVWLLTYIGRPMTNLDGGLFRIRISFSPRFPEEQPRVRFETNIFHHRIAADGTVCYWPNPMRRDYVKSHIEAIIAALEDEEPAYDPRTLVNREAYKLYWGGPVSRRDYSRRLRRSVQRSMDEF